MKTLILFTIVTSITLFSCNKFDKAEVRPAFLKIDSFNLTTNLSSEGSNSNKIVDAWVYVDDELVGTFDLPSLIPITKIGNRTIKIYPGIKKNGVSVDRKRYPFYKEYSFNQNLESDSTYIIEPNISYKDNLMIWVEDFEDPSYKFNPYQSDTTLVRVTSPVNELFEGGAGLLTLSSDQYQCEMRTNEPIFNNMPTSLSSDAYLELDYSSNYKLEIGILANSISGEPYERSPLITLNPTNNAWNKTYLYIPDASNFFSGSPEFDIYFRALNPNQSNDIKIYVDNIKVIFWN